jgi:cold shock CspA family protein
MIGTVTHIRREQGYAFIRSDEGGADFFLHRQVMADFDRLDFGSRVTFEPTIRQGRRRAKSARLP